jgi:hypothetical protein
MVENVINENRLKLIILIRGWEKVEGNQDKENLNEIDKKTLFLSSSF